MKPATLLLTLFLSALLPGPADSEDCQKAIALYNQGTLSNDLEEKEGCFKQAIPLCSNPEVLSRVYNNLADLYETREELSQALLHYRKALEIKGDLATPYVSAGDIFFKLGDYYSAFILYGKGVRHLPDDEGLRKSREEAERGWKQKMLLYFDLGSSRIPDPYRYRLQQIGEAARSKPGRKRVTVVGYTCDLGPQGYNRRLSRRRAEAVARTLKSHFPLGESTVITLGRGEEGPLLPNRDEEARVLNRRVEVTVE